MSRASLDQSKALKLTYRKGEGRAFTLIVTDPNVSGTPPYDLSSLEFQMEGFDVYDRDDSFFILTEASGEGLVKDGPGGTLVIEPSDDDVDQEEGFYEYRLKTLDPLNTWFNAVLEIVNSPQPYSNEETDEADLEVDLGGGYIVNVNVRIGYPV